VAAGIQVAVAVAVSAAEEASVAAAEAGARVGVRAAALSDVATGLNRAGSSETGGKRMAFMAWCSSI
jgi:hypothetical protein